MGATEDLVGSRGVGFDAEAACDPVGHGLEVSKGKVSASSLASELKEAVDGLDGGGGRVVFEVAEDAVEVPLESSSELVALTH